MATEHEALQRRHTQHQTFHRAEVYALQPSKHRRPATHASLLRSRTRQLSPVHPGTRVMFDMIPVIAEQKVIEPAVVTDRPACVFIMSLQEAQPDADQKAREVNRHCKA